jgi:hypothetical protein
MLSSSPADSGQSTNTACGHARGGNCDTPKSLFRASSSLANVKVASTFPDC